ncbi:MAG: bifunctional (p)ppGpp synthetase/guanosine-3',5'-bis(diphosphate) 3'-pyrophosphohydrolase [Holosporales bacterium]|nr:bifunctional (p)ppGpp synthetase/guanosine-3',5'-bis(diphosphate) 3'-pyrophosphohydrolase [Holosporales bacterium]
MTVWLILVTQQDLISGIREYCADVDEELIKRAYIFTLEKHGTQLRESGDPFFSHPIEVAEILISLKMDQNTVIAGILHDTIEDTDATYEEIAECFSEKVAKIVDGVTKLSKFESSSLAERQTENFRKLLISAASDIRVLIIKLADRLHNMRTLKFKKKLRRLYIAKETLEIYAPLAERIGMVGIKDELQDIAFAELHPEIYKSIKSRLKHLYDVSENMISSITEEIRQLALNIDIPCIITGRLKAPYSIWEKIKVRNISFEQLADIMAFRIIVDSIAQCYQMLGCVHRNYLVIPGRFRDYISTPKNNSYQSLHTCVIGPLNKRVEIQIRTKEMHQIAEFGIAAHCDYKTNGSQKQRKPNDYRWIRNLVSILENTSNIEEFLANSKTEILSDTVFCITPKGTIMSLPRGSSVLDFAYSIHSDIGNHASVAKINGSPVPLRTIVENGDQIEIVVDPKQVPSLAWEGYVTTIKAKTAIKKFLSAFERERITMIGKSNFYDCIERYNIDVNETEVKQICKALKFNAPSQMFYAIGSAQLTMREIIVSYNEIRSLNLDLYIVEKQVSNINSEDKLPIFGLPDLPVVPVACCSPIPGDRIVGVAIEDVGIEIHIEKCQVFPERAQEANSRVVDLAWSKKAFEANKKYPVGLHITSTYEPGNLSEIATVIESKGGTIVNLKVGERYDNVFQIQVEVEVADIVQLIMINAALRSVPFINKVVRE